ncbi:MAG: tetratricopeptide repeat protein [Saprospiraceae bacterium]|nr:tetratricopeptide repeat protein [Lewinella sp.]
MPKSLFPLLFAVLFLWGCKHTDSSPEATSLTGQTLYSPPPSEKLLADLANAKATYEADSTNVDNLIWYARRTAYPGYYRDAIAIYSRGIERFPDDARLYRHRGHRHITIREFDKAIANLVQAVQLIEGTEDEIEPDGMPNAQNIPLTTLHSNIWYHLGLAYYLKHDWAKALACFTNCRLLELNDDNIVSSTHWIYMIFRRIGSKTAAAASLEGIHADMNIVENESYWKLCRFYQGAISESELLNADLAIAANDAVHYGLANWYLYNGDTGKAKELLEQLLAKDSWNSFGYIAAEADWVDLFGK